MNNIIFLKFQNYKWVKPKNVKLITSLINGTVGKRHCETNKHNHIHENMNPLKVIQSALYIYQRADSQNRKIQRT